MVAVGIEAMNLFGGSAYVDVMELAAHRKLDTARFDNLLMKQKAVALPYEDPVTFGINAAKPIVDGLSDSEKERIELLICCSESGIDFGKSMGTYMHQYLGLPRNCRMFELKQACYSGTAGFQMAINFILSQVSPGAKALVIATDISRFLVAEGGDVLTMDWAFTEPSGGAGAMALLVSETPEIFQVDVGANGYYGYEVMDTCRPIADSEAGNADLSLLSYLDCCEQTFLEYQRRVADVDYRNSFQYLCFHTPFGGMVKGAHRLMMRKMAKAGRDDIEQDFHRRVAPGLSYCQRVGNIMGATVLLSLAGSIDQGVFDSPQRLGCFSYGSGCCSEFYSGVVTSGGQQKLGLMNIGQHLDYRYKLSMDEYEALLDASNAVKFGTRNVEIDIGQFSGPWQAGRHNVVREGKARVYLSGIKEFHRQYQWLAGA
ncbi:MAG: hydroxymethylglutaryl-CoA synthase [Methylovulum sp.]|nr:hydroxymethylglutaryl-CoA synthase [Methylovulum sp.]